MKIFIVYLSYENVLGKTLRGEHMKRVNPAIRVLGFLIDGIIIMIPVQFILLGILHVPVSQAEMLLKFLFAVYGVLFMSYTKGATIGKLLGKTCVVTTDDMVPSLMEYGIRELVKSMYFIPIFGWILAFISCGMICFGKGRGIHDYIVHTKVIYVWNRLEETDGDER